MKTSGILIFAGIISLLAGLMHWYIWARLVRDAAWPAPWGKALAIGLFSLAILIPAAILSLRLGPRWMEIPLSWAAYIWMGFAVYLFLFSVLSDAGRSAASVLGILPTDPERRKFVFRALATGAGALSGITGIWGIISAARGFKIKHVRVPLSKLPEKASGYSIVQITDVHVGPTLGRNFVESIVREANALMPDMLVITGDLVDGSVEQLREQVEPLRDLKAKDGVFFVTGNHEYYSGADSWIAHLETLGIRVLRNERVDIRGIFDLAGVDDISAAKMLPHHGQDMAKAMQGRDPSRAMVLLAHQPKAFKHALAAGVDLQLSGHVHAGQMIPFNWLAHIDQPFISGLHQVEKTWIYVSAGTGYWGPPMRVGTTAEITRIELVSGGEAQG